MNAKRRGIAPNLHIEFTIAATLEIIERTGAERRARLAQQRAAAEQRQREIWRLFFAIAKTSLKFSMRANSSDYIVWASQVEARQASKAAAIKARSEVRDSVSAMIQRLNFPALPEWSVTTGKRTRNRKAKAAVRNKSQACISDGDLNRYNHSGRRMRLCVGPQSLAASRIYAGR